MEKGQSFPTLDHGYVKLIDWMGDDARIVESARMSTGKGFVSWDPYYECSVCGRKSTDLSQECACTKMVAKPDGDTGFLEFLFKSGHSSPFEQCELVIEVQAPIFVFREWHRHRTQSYNEFSARYSQMPNVHYLPEKGRIQKQSKTNKQGSDEHKSLTDSEAEGILVILDEQQGQVYETYDAWVEQGIAKEIARINTPVSRFSKMRAKANLLNWLKFLNLRMRPNAMWEIRQYANIVASIIDECFPKTYNLFEEHWLYARSFSRTEISALYNLFTIFADNPAWLRGEAKKVGMNDKKFQDLLKKLMTPADTIL